MSAADDASASTPHLAAWTGTYPLRVLASEFLSDLDEYSVFRAARRAARKSRVFAMNKAYQQLLDLPAYRLHVSTLSKQDRLFFLSERHYLASGLTPRQRLEAALVHYGHDSEAFYEDYLRTVYHGGGIVLWSKVVAGVEYDIRLVPGRDVSVEGALSIVLNVDGTSVCVLSYSIVTTDVVLGSWLRGADEAPLADTIIYVTRKHLTRERGYQAQFNKAFDRSTPSHLCFGALTGIALAQGRNHVLGIDPERNPAVGIYTRAHAEFWTSLSGRKVSPYGYLVDLPIRLTPLKDLEPSKRKRAVVRRGHIEAVQQSAQAAISVHLRAR